MEGFTFKNIENQSIDFYHNITVIPPGIAFNIIYPFCATLGIGGNLLLFFAVRKELGPFGDRRTFTFLVQFICILDLVLSSTIILDIILLRASIRLKYYDYFVHPRNIVLTLESYALLLIAIDRFMALKRPYSQRWNCSLVYRTLGVLTGLTVVFDVSCLITKHCNTCPIRVQLGVFFLYIGIYTGVFCLIMILTYTVYLLLFIAFMQYTQYSACRLQRSSNIQLLADSDRRDTSRGPESEHIEQRTLWNNRGRLARTLFIVSFVYTSSMVPHILAGWEFIPFPGYIVYDLFYLNAVANPFIYILTDANFRRDLLEHFRRKKSAVLTGSTSLEP